MSNYSKSELVDLDRRHNIHPYMDFAGSRKIIQRGSGAYVYDQDGNKYLDGIGGLWCVNVGHGRQELAQAMSDQAAELAYFSTFVIFSNQPSTILAKKLVTLSPDNLNHVYFTAGGSEANDCAVRIIHNYFNLQNRPNKKLIIARKEAYHGMTYLTASISGIADNNDNYHTVSGLVHHLSAPNCYRPQNNAHDEQAYLDFLVEEFKQKIHTLKSENIAAFFAEPIMGAGGLYVAPKGYHRKMWELCKENDIIYVSDEVVTAFCRLGEFFTSEKIFNIKPDIITFAKGVTSGYIPLGGVLLSSEIYAGISKGSFTSAYTYSAHPVSTAVANKNIDLMQTENICGHVNEISPYLWDRLRQLNSPYIGDIRGMHFMLGMEFVKDQATKERFHKDVKFANRVSDKALADGLIIRPVSPDIIVISPTLIWEKLEVDKFVDILDRSLSAVEFDLKKENII